MNSCHKLALPKPKLSPNPTLSSFPISKLLSQRHQPNQFEQAREQRLAKLGCSRWK